ncbi:MAG: GT4 family glycosyltransferase PelF [Desulfovibrionaceae bacterium]
MTERIPDVCLILEGTYPFVSGGVSTWVHHLIRAMPELTFTAVCIRATSKDPGEYKYDPPQNFVDPMVIYLHDHENLASARMSRQQKAEFLATIRDWHTRVHSGQNVPLTELVAKLDAAGGKIDLNDLVHGREPWNLMVEFYKRRHPEASFLDYFWTYRFTHLPICNVLNTELPRAKVYHTISTGFAGLLAVLAGIRMGRPILLTEHGIYTKERKIEIAQSKWIHAEEDDRLRIERDLGTFQKLWIHIFESLSRLTYAQAYRVLTLFEGNRQMQIQGGSDPDRTVVIPNGITLSRYTNLRPRADTYEDNRGLEGPFEIGFVGRVVPIKDVKTFIRACKIVSQDIQNFTAFVIGPEDESPEYARECHELVHMLGLDDRIVFTGKVNVNEYYARLDLLVLTSVSEAQPLVILEANCAGVPVVASDVGACCELLHGRTPEDEAIGPSGYITRPAEPMDTAQGILTILSNPELRRRMSLNGRERVERFYAEADLIRQYEALYHECMARPDAV